MATPAAVLTVLLEANTGKASTQLRGMQTQLQQVNRHATDTEKSSGRLGRTFGVAGAAAAKAEGGFRSVGSRLASVGSIAAGTSLGVAAVGVASVNASLKFQQSMLLVHTQAGYAQRDVDKLTKAVLAMGPKVGFGPDMLAQALFHIASSGVPAAKAMSVLSAAAKGARVGAADLVSTTNALVGIMRTAPKDVKGAADAMGTLSAIVGQGNMKMDDLTGAISTGVLPAAKTFGLGLRDVGAALDTMTARGMPAEQSATRLKMTFSMLAAPTKQAAGALQSIGLNATQMAVDMRKPNGLVVALSDLKTHLEGAGLSAVQQAQVLSKAFGGGRTSAGIMLLLQNIDDLKKHTDALGQQNGTKALDAAFAQTQRDAAANMERIKAALQTFEIEAGMALQPVVMWLSRFIQQMIKGQGAGGQFAMILKAAFTAVKDAVQAVFPVFRLLASILAGLTHVLGTQLTGALVAVAIALAVGSPLIAGIAALLIIITHLQTVSRGFSIVWGLAWRAIQHAAGAAISFILGGFSSMLGGIASVANTFSHLPGPIGDAFAKVRDAAHSGQHAIDAFRHTVENWGNETKTDLPKIVAHYQDMANRVGVSILLARDAIHTGSRQAAHFAIVNFDAIAGQIQIAMDSGRLSTQTGAKLIAQVLQDTLTAFGGAKIPGVGKVLAAAYPGLPKFTATSPALQATGGLIQVGRKGAAGRDNVPMNVGGMPIMVGEGEQVAVFTRHQQKVANQALAPYGGLPGLFSKVNRPNYMATGGYVGNVVLDPGVNMTVGQEPQILADLRKLSAELQKTVYVISGYRSPAHSVAVGGFSNDPHTQGAAADIGVGSSLRDTMFGVTDQQLRAIGLYRPFYPASAAEVNHVQLLAGGAAGSGGVGGAVGALAQMWKNIGVPKVEGNGTIPSIVRGALTMMTKQANKFGQQKVGAGSFTGTLSGPVERQVYQFMSAAGFNKIAIAGMLGNAMQESSMNPNTPGGGLWQQISNFGSGTGGTLLQQMQTMLPQILGLRGSMNAAGSPGAAAVIFEQGFERAGVPAMANRISAANAAYAAGYSKGGLLPQAFATGGLPLYSGYGSKWTGPRSRLTPPKPKGGTSIGLKQLAGKDMGPINKAMDELNNLVGDTGDIAKLQERYTAFDSLFQALHPNLQYLVQPADGSAAYVDDAAVHDSLAELLQLQTWEQQIIADYHRVQKLAPQVLKAIDVAIKVRRQAIEELKARIRANLQKIAALEKLITVAQKAKNTTLAAQYKKQVGVLKADNATLGGSATSVGTTGRIGALSAEITALQDRSGKAGDMLVSAQGLTGAGGALATENVNLIGLQAQIKPLQDWVTSKGGDLAVQLAATVQSSTGPATGSGLDPNLAAQLALQEQLTTQAQQALAVSQAQYATLQLPFAGSFAAGGIVPGPVGAPAMAVVHGGEAIGQPGDIAVNLHFANGMEWLRGFVRAEVASKGRGDAGLARRALPGGGGGI